MTENIKGISDISGFGKETSYEKGCQNMLQAGFDFLEKNNKGKLKGHSYKGIYGIFEPDSKKAKELSKVIVKAEPECSGVMHQIVMGHLIIISSNGLEKWKEEVREVNERGTGK